MTSIFLNAIEDAVRNYLIRKACDGKKVDTNSAIEADIARTKRQLLDSVQKDIDRIEKKNRKI